jgi:hypothetical protein
LCHKFAQFIENRTGVAAVKAPTTLEQLCP